MVGNTVIEVIVVVGLVIVVGEVVAELVGRLSSTETVPDYC
ncbi:MAG: hypothetical protein AB8V23_04995 [Candidatus Midichloria sp.]|uniref:Uncharacterized protein n=1 Tax=Hyalomma marginatum TaxID=34627 RepID=A0A8S4C3I9_9ACAR|nr:hypothetical protein MHYMCMPSP_00039 [Hyalomma marginatum]CAG7589413.1 hypothetical protein MHYMCMPASI_00140 [Hyalomma marginatum]